MTALRLYLVCYVLSWSCVSAEDFTLPEKLPEHPRIFFTKKKETEIKKLMKTDAFLDKLVKELIQKADHLTNEPPSHSVTIGSTMSFPVNNV
jgi:hypothetical protein